MSNSKTGLADPLVSAVITTFDNGPLAVEAVRSVQAQTYQPIECVVVDDGSGPQTLAMLRGLGHEIRLIERPHKGISAARNAGVRESGGELVAFLDADDLWTPEKIARCVPRFAESERVGAAYTRVVVADSVKGQRYELSVYDIDGRMEHALFLDCRMSMSSLVARRDALLQVGLFDESMAMAEDWDLMLRLAEQFDFAHVPEPLTIRRIHGENITSRRSDLYPAHYLKVLRKALERRPDAYRPLEARAMAKARFRFGLEHYRRFDMAPARREFVRSLRRRPTCEAFSYWARTFLPVALVKRLRAWRERGVRDAAGPADPGNEKEPR